MNHGRHALEPVIFTDIQVFITRAHPQPACSIRTNTKYKSLVGSSGHCQICQSSRLPARQTIAQRANPDRAVGVFANRPGWFCRKLSAGINRLKPPFANSHQSPCVQTRPPVALVIFKEAIDPLPGKALLRTELPHHAIGGDMPQTPPIVVKPHASVMIFVRSHPAQVAGENVIKRFRLKNPSAANRLAHVTARTRPQAAAFGNG